MRKLLILLIFCLSFSLIALGRPIFAHFPDTDGDITVVLHVEPDDDPIPKQNAMLYFIFEDATNKFNLADCYCTVSVTEQGKQIFFSQILPNQHQSVYGAGIPIIFPDRNIYTIHLEGSPNKINEFQHFSLSWNFRVDQYPIGTKNSFSIQDVLIPVGIATTLSLALFGTIFLSLAVSDRLKKHKRITSS